MVARSNGKYYTIGIAKEAMNGNGGYRYGNY